MLRINTKLLCYAATSISISATLDSANAAIFEPDARQYAVPHAQSPLAAVGMVTRGLLVEHRSTGTLVDDCHVLTSQHLFGMTTSPIGKRARFVGLVGTPREIASGGTAIAAGGLDKVQVTGVDTNRWADDWALIRLDQCLGKKLGFARLAGDLLAGNSRPEIQSAGYPMNRSSSSGMTIDVSCHVTAGSAWVWRTDCPLYYGDSGGPLFRLASDTRRQYLMVYAIKSAGVMWQAPVRFDASYANFVTPVGQIIPKIEQYLSSGAEASGAFRTPERLVANDIQQSRASLSRVSRSADPMDHLLMLDARLDVPNSRPRPARRPE